MPDTRTRPGVDRRPLISYLKVQRDYERQLRSILEDAASSISLELYGLESKTGIGAEIRRAQLVAAQANVHRQLEQMWLDIGDTVQAGRQAAAAAAAEASLPYDALRKVLPQADVDYMLQSSRATAARGIETLEARLKLSKIPLSESVYKDGMVSKGAVDEIINSGLASGLSAAEIARNVRNFVSPTTPGGASYAAMRLGRTELNNAFHAQQVQEGIKTPWTHALKWNLSGSHPVPDECNVYAEDTHFEGGGAGEFKPDQIPAKPHPNCLCFTTPVTDDREEFIRKLQAGSYDDYLDKEFGLDPSSRFSSAPTASKPLGGTKVDPKKPLKPELDPGFAKLPRRSQFQMSNPTMRADVKNVNPAGANHRNYDHRTNCHFVVETAEMRARGYNVVARPTVNSTGRLQQVIDNGWRTESGELRSMSYLDTGGVASRQAFLRAAEEFTADWPDGARGFVTGPWKTGSAHTFNVEKINGRLVFTDAQVQEANVEHYLDNLQQMGILRVDDLVPQKQVLDAFTADPILVSTEESQMEAAYALFRQYDEAYAVYVDNPRIRAVIDQQLVKLRKAIVARGGTAPRAVNRNRARKAAGIS